MANLVSIVIGATTLLLPSWQAVTVVVIAVITAVLVLLPPSMEGYVVAPKERRVM
jgi:hypothetical protein